MSGHKGNSFLGMEHLDITEIDGADSLYQASGIIAQSEANASQLFGCRTLYSTEGSSLSIRAMLYLASLMKKGERALILAGRNAHKVFLSAAALLDFDVEWIVGKESYLSCNPSADELAARLDSMVKKPTAVYITSPDYLGNMADIGALAEVCHERGILLLVDNAHGAYLAFTEPSTHPIALGADMCTDSAHKTLPCLTGAAYLHISKAMPKAIVDRAKGAMALFGSTSPSYLILASLDMANAYLSNGYGKKLGEFTKKLDCMKKNLVTVGYEVVGNEPMKLTLKPKSYGYTGHELAGILKKNKIVHEFADPDYLVLMPTPEITDEELAKLEVVLLTVERRNPITTLPPRTHLGEMALTPREAILSEAESVSVERAEGRILADTSVGCPPAVPIAVSGERIDKSAIDAFKYYGIDSVFVVK